MSGCLKFKRALAFTLHDHSSENVVYTFCLLTKIFTLTFMGEAKKS
jgi:hypothetical protein